MNFFTHLRAAWLFAKQLRYIEEADAENFWTPADAEWLQRMFEAHSGRKLKMRLTNFAIRSAMDAVRSPDPRQPAISAGIQIGISAIDAHFPQATAHRGESETSSDDAALDALEPDTA